MKETKNVHTREEIFPHQRRNISTPEKKYFHTREEKCPHQRRNISTPVRQVFIHAGPKEHLLYTVLVDPCWSKGKPLVS